ncbi:UbiA prenyltransferase family-domain-containing protein [Roridomyces roridus]|uniref:UbiA prenyltransferase family-domain-containing protein n=1 Tax=Roridomyces roridus TaxID=1738132 RepID=A0AAD7BAF2_9AGAR|nr:UbiA prenyltransferase family-domain-containing protein [Roridomyces roridus]
MKSPPFAGALYTLYLFTKSDIKTTVIPITFLASASAPLASISRLPHITFWIWLHLLQFDVSNQTMDPEEDAMNKQDRPLPSKRMTLEQAIILRWILVPLCFAWSLCYSVETLYASIALRHWFIRNAVNAAGFAAFEVGATLVAGYTASRLDHIAVISVAISGGIFATTIHAQDFKDVDGDRAIGRRTIPIVLPSIARWTVIIPLTLWSLGLAFVWELDLIAALVFVSLAISVGTQYLRSTSVRGDQVGFYWYNVRRRAPSVGLALRVGGFRCGCPLHMLSRATTEF